MEPEVTVLEAAKIVDVHPESVKRWIRSGELYAKKQGTLYFIKRKDLDAFRLIRKERKDLKRSDSRAYWATPQGAFVDRIGEQLDGLLDDQPLGILTIEPGGGLYAEHLTRYLTVVKDRNPTLVRLPMGDAAELGETIRAAKAKLKGRKLLLVDDDTCTGDTYKTVTDVCFNLSGEVGFDEFFIGALAEFFEIIVAPFLTGHVNDFDLIHTAKRIPLAVYTDTIAIASFFVRRPHKSNR